MVVNQELTQYKGLLERVRNLPQPRIYQNSTPVVTVNGVGLTTWDVLTAAVIGNLNVLIVGEGGEGKTQLLNELKDGFFGGNATYIRMRDNLRAKDLYEVYNMSKLFAREGRVSDAKELTGIVQNGLTTIDEINRAHEKIQNQVFDIFDGYIVFDGPKGPVKINLGRMVDAGIFYHVVVASANIGSDRYIGTSPIDPALLDRSHVILNVDNFSPTTLDDVAIIGGTETARLVDYTNSDKTEEIIGIYRDVKGIHLSFDALITLLYLKKGLDACIHPQNPTHRKLPLLSAIPDMCTGCRELAGGCGYITPISTRTEKATVLFAKALKVVADAKSGDEVEGLRVTYQDVLSAFSLIGPFSGILDNNWVRKEFLGNHQFGINNLVKKIGLEMHGLQEVLLESFTQATEGNLTDGTRDRYQVRWAWFGDVLVALNAAAQKHGNLRTLKGKQLEVAVKESPIVRWLT